MPILGLVACSKSKGLKPSLALLLYKGAMFKKSIALARRDCDAVAILSAKHGLVQLRQRLAPYEQTLSTMTRPDRLAWSVHVRDQLQQTYPGYQIRYYAGLLYCQDLPKGDTPMAGMPMGVRLQWLNRQLQKE